MELAEAQRIVGEKVENPTASIPDETLIDALATVIARNGLLFVQPDPSGLVRLAFSPGLEATPGFDATAPPGFGDKRTVPGLGARSSQVTGAWEVLLLLVAMSSEHELEALTSTLEDDSRNEALAALTCARKEIERQEARSS